MVFIIFMIIAGGIRADQCIRHVDGSTSTSRYEDKWVLHALCTWVDTEEVLCMFIVGFITHTKMRPCIVSKEKEYMFMNWANERMLQRWHIYTKLKLSFVINQRRLCNCTTTVSGTLYTADPSVQIMPSVYCFHDILSATLGCLPSNRRTSVLSSYQTKSFLDMFCHLDVVKDVQFVSLASLFLVVKNSFPPYVKQTIFFPPE